MMRAWELTENNQPPTKPITLRGLHKLKIEAKLKSKRNRERLAFMPKMYGNPEAQRERLELERLRLEMAQLHAEILGTNADTAKTRVDTENKSAMALHHSAQSGLNAAEKRDQKLTKLAKSGIGRSLKE